MASVNARNGTLFFDFRYNGVRCREYTKLEDTAANRKLMRQLLGKIEAEITLGSFDYAKYFPNSPNIERTKDKAAAITHISGAPTFSTFADQVLPELEVPWRISHRETQKHRLEHHLKPYFGQMAVTQIAKTDVLQFRAQIAKLPGKKGATISPSAINHIMSLLNQIMAEAAERFDFTSPCLNVKSLKVPKTQVDPFPIHEVRQILDTVRSDFRNYYIVRFFTGLRPAEIDGLKWKFVDFERREILIRETFVLGRTEYTKNDGSQREVRMTQPVFEALQAQHGVTSELSEYVFCSREGTPLTNKNVTKRVWYPLLRQLGLKMRNPYQTRHTAATLWLASGENPEWIARQMGHTTTEMLFRVYSRYVPNLTRQDGTAFDRLITSALAGGVIQHSTEAEHV